MPQLLVLATIGVGAYFGVRWVRKKARQITREMEAARRAARQTRRTPSPYEHVKSARVTELEQDPETGVYKVKDE